MRIHAFKYAILGGGVVAGYAAQEFVEQEIKSGELCIISADSTLPYDRPPLSKGFLAGKKDTHDILINNADFYDKHGIRVFLDAQVEQVKLPVRELVTNTDDHIRFEKLLIATGSQVRKLDIPGAQRPGVFYLRTVDDARRIAAEAQTAQKVVVVGGGYIGMEVTSVLTSAGIEVTMVFPEQHVMQRLFPPEMSAFFERYYQDRGVRFITGVRPASFNGNGHISSVTLDNGEELPADMVVAGIGVEPVVDLFRGTGIHIDNGVVVNKYLETNRDGILAAGDVANYYDVIFQKRRRVEHWDNAVRMGRHAAKVMTAGSKRDSFMYLRYFFSDVFDLSYEFWGDTDYADRVVYRGDVNSGSFSTWWLAGSRVDAVFVMDRPDEERDLAPKWIKARRRVSPVELQDKNHPLSEMIPQFV